METFVAIDFETSHHKRDSACSVGLVRVEQGRVAERVYRLIRPTHQPFMFTQVHGLRWRDVAREPEFGQVWREVSWVLEGAAFLAAHNAPFDRSVLLASCEGAGLTPPRLPFVCTVQLAKKTWALPSATLSEVCSALQIPLKHHHALSDAEACAQIVVKARAKATIPNL